MFNAVFHSKCVCVRASLCESDRFAQDIFNVVFQLLLFVCVCVLEFVSL